MVQSCARPATYCALSGSSMQVSQVQALGEELLREPVKRVNNVSKLLTALGGAKCDEAICKKVTLYLKQFFLISFERGGLTPQTVPGSSLAAEDKLRAWLKQKYDSFVDLLQGQLQAPEADNLQVATLGTIMELIRGQQAGVFDKALFSKAMTVLLQSQTVSEDVLQLLISKYMPCADVRFYTLRAIHNITEGVQAAGLTTPGVLRGEQAGHRLCQVLAAISPTLTAGTEDEAVQSWCGALEAGVVGAAPAAGEGSQQRRKRKREQALSKDAAPLLGAVQWANPAAYRRAFSDAWLGLLRLPLPSDLLKNVLVQLHSTVIPHIPNPLLLSDFLTRCLGEGGLVGMLALNGIFTLVTKHGLEYPNFYAKLYALLQAPVFRARYRARFLQLADIFLSSGMVPAYTAAAFIKKFARLALTAPPAGAIIAIAFIHNLLRRHPSCSVLLNKPLSSTSAHTADAVAPQNPTALSQTAAATEAASSAAMHNGLPHMQTNGHAKDDPHINGSSSDASSSSSGGDDSSDTEAANRADDRVVVQGQGQGQEAVSGARSACVGQDVFDEHEADPAKCRAIESSLWELESLRHHYYHTVASYVSILDKDLGDRKRTAEVDVGALLRSSYSEYIVLETERRLKSVPVAYYSSPPSQLFPKAAKVEFSGWVC